MVSLILLIKYFFLNKASLKLGFLKTLFHFFQQFSKILIKCIIYKYFKMINLSGSLESKIAHGVWVGGMILVSLIVSQSYTILL